MKADEPVYPTHQCFDDSLDLLVDMLKERPKLIDDLHLIHAICRAPSGELYAHAWLENKAQGVAYFAGVYCERRIHLACSATEYRKSVNVEESTSYSYPEAYALNCLHNNYGPWIEKYRALCSSKRRIFNEG